MIKDTLKKFINNNKITYFDTDIDVPEYGLDVFELDYHIHTNLQERKNLLCYELNLISCSDGNKMLNRFKIIEDFNNKNILFNCFFIKDEYRIDVVIKLSNYYRNSIEIYIFNQSRININEKVDKLKILHKHLNKYDPYIDYDVTAYKISAIDIYESDSYEFIPQYLLQMLKINISYIKNVIKFLKKENII